MHTVTNVRGTSLAKKVSDRVYSRIGSGVVQAGAQQDRLGNTKTCQRLRRLANPRLRPLGENDPRTRARRASAQFVAKGHVPNRALSAPATAGETSPSSGPPNRATSRTIDEER